MDTLRERTAKEFCKADCNQTEGVGCLREHPCQYALYHTDSILALIRAEVRGIENPYHINPNDDNFTQDYNALCFNLFEQCRQAVLKALE